jgi:predicted nucleotidyltransferase
MIVNNEIKEDIKRQIIESLGSESEIRKIIIFGSFIHSVNPKDIDIAIIQESNQPYLTLALKYRKLMRNLARKIPLDIIPLKSNTSIHWFLDEINSGELIYEK